VLTAARGGHRRAGPGAAGWGHALVHSVDAAVPNDLDLHLVLDNYATRKLRRSAHHSVTELETGIRKWTSFRVWRTPVMAGIAGFGLETIV
jgi:hypothetical protein